MNSAATASRVHGSATAAAALNSAGTPATAMGSAGIRPSAARSLRGAIAADRRLADALRRVLGYPRRHSGGWAGRFWPTLPRLPLPGLITC